MYNVAIMYAMTRPIMTRKEQEYILRSYDVSFKIYYTEQINKCTRRKCNIYLKS